MVGLFACASPDEPAATQADGSSGPAETGTGGRAPSGNAPTDEPTTAGTTRGADESGEPTDPTGDAPASDDAPASGSSSGAATSGQGETSAGDEGRGAACVELEACCDEIGSALFGGCISVVQMDNPALCDSILTNYHQEGYCTGETFCAELGDCCPELPPGPGWQETCEYYADFGNQPQCAMLIGDYQLSDYCL